MLASSRETEVDNRIQARDDGFAGLNTGASAVHVVDLERRVEFLWRSNIEIFGLGVDGLRVSGVRMQRQRMAIEDIESSRGRRKESAEVRSREVLPLGRRKAAPTD